MALDRSNIVEAALALLNEVGIDQLTTRKLAERLGVQQPALYWHFRNKSELLDALNEAVIARYHVRRLPAPGETWDAFTLANARSIRRALLSVRDGARLNAGTRPTARQFGDAEQWLELCVNSGFTPQEALGISISIARYVVGFVLEEQGERERSAQEAQEHAGAEDELAPFPLLRAAVEPLFRAGGTINTENVFESGLGYIIAGIRASRSSASEPPYGRKAKRAP